MRYEPISNELFRENRNRLVKKLAQGSLVVIHSNDILTTSGDGLLPFRQHSNFFYLTGIDQEESSLILAPDHPDPSKREILFIRETNDVIVTWEGPKLSQSEASDVSGINTVMWSQHFESVLDALIPEFKQVYLDAEENPRASKGIVHRNDRFIKAFQEDHPVVDTMRLAPILTDLRMVKSAQEVKLMEQAAEIAAKGYRTVLSTIKPGQWEYEIEGEFIREFIGHRSRGFAYNPIIASGSNACILHYELNNRQCQNGELVLMDVGAEYANYNSDVTRTVPVSGKFTDRQRLIYQAVLEVKNKATEILRPGKTLKEFNQEVGGIMEEALIEIGLLSAEKVKDQDPEKPLYRKYYMHSTAHHLGLDVHDMANPHTPLAPGMILTVEPGIYIKEESLGIRLEDDMLIGDDTNTNLTESIPIEIAEIESIMSR